MPIVIIVVTTYNIDGRLRTKPFIKTIRKEQQLNKLYEAEMIVSKRSR